MAAPVLLVADDLSLIAAVKRALAREGYECVLATSAADAIVAFGHHLPGLVLLQPGVESGRGQVLLEELQAHPEAALLKVVLLGETLPGFGLPVEPLPVDARHLVQSIEENRRAGPIGRKTPVPTGSELDTWSGPGGRRTPVPPGVDLDLGLGPATRRTPLPQGSELDTWRTGPFLPAAAEAPLAPPPGGPPADLSLLETVQVQGGTLKAFPQLSPAPAEPPPPEFADTVRSGQPSASGGRERVPDWASPRRTQPPRLEADLEDLPPPSGVPPEPADEAPPAPTPAPTAPMAAPRRRAITSPQFPGAAFEPGAAGPTPPFHPPEAAGAAPAPEAGAPPPEEASSAGYRPERALLDPVSSPSALALEDRLFGDLPALEDPAPPDAGPPAPDAAGPAFSGSRASPAPPLPARVQAALARAEAMAVEGRDAARARREEEAARAGEAEAALHEGRRRAEHAEGLAREEREGRAEVEAQLRRLHEANQRLEEALEAERSQHARAVDAARAHADVRVTKREQTLSEQASGWQQRLASAEAALERARGDAQDLTAQLQQRDEALAELARRRDEKVAELARQREERLADLTRQQGEAISALTRRHDERLVELRRQLAEAQAAAEIARSEAASASDSVSQLEAEQLAHDATRRAHAEAEARASQLQSENTLVEEARSEAELGRQAAAEAAEAAEAARAALAAHRGQLEAQLGTAQELVEEAGLQRQRLETEVASLRASLTEARSAIAAQEQEKATLREELERAAARQAAGVKELAQARDDLDQARSRAEQTEATLALAHQKLDELERRNTVQLALPGRRPVGVLRHGEVDLDGLAGLVGQLVVAHADVGLELGVPGGQRGLWLKGGQLVGATSSFAGEGLIDRARQDGLIDGRQEAELRLVKSGTVREQLEALKGRRMIREVEAVPLLQRHAEHLALQALSEPHSQYRLAEEPPRPEVTLVTIPRPTLPLLAEALRRAVDPQGVLARLGGGDAVPQATDAELDLRALGFSDRERRLLGRVDGETNVETLALESGLRAEAAFRALLVGQLLGLLVVHPPTGESHPATPDPELDARRLLAKYDQVLDADYFSILGLDRGAGTEEVRRAFERLREEFHPLRFSGHPDAGIQERAHQVFRFLEEAARALEDDGRRADYARHLLD